MPLHGGQIEQRMQHHGAQHQPAQPLVRCLVQAGVEVEKHQDARHGGQGKAAHHQRCDPGALFGKVHGRFLRQMIEPRWCGRHLKFDFGRMNAR